MGRLAIYHSMINVSPNDNRWLLGNIAVNKALNGFVTVVRRHLKIVQIRR